MATINHKKYDEATETFKDFNVYDGKETLIFKVDGEGQKTEFEKPVSFAGGLEDFVSNDQPAIYRAFSTTGSYPFNRYGDLVIQARSSHDRNIVFAAGTSPAVIASMTSDGLCFGSDTAAANALDDYEEGTWTPAANNLTLNYTVSGSYGFYTKIGNLVTVFFDIAWTSVNVGSATTYINNLPFAVGSGTGKDGSGAIRYITSVGSFDQINCYAGKGTSGLYFSIRSSGVISSDATANQLWGTSNRVIGSVTYMV